MKDKILERTREILKENKVWADEIELLNFAIVYATAQKDLLLEQKQQLEEKLK